MIKIALDMDSVLADIAPVECQIIEEVTGKKIGKLHLKQWDWLDLYDLRKDISLDKIFRTVWERWFDVHPTEEYLGGKVGELMLLGQVDIVSANWEDNEQTNKVMHKNKKEWLTKYHIPYSNLVFVDHNKNKLDLDYDIWIDDSPVNAEAAVKRGKPLFLYTQPWNMGHDYPFPVERIFSLSDARRLLRTNRI